MADFWSQFPMHPGVPVVPQAPNPVNQPPTNPQPGDLPWHTGANPRIPGAQYYGDPLPGGGYVGQDEWTYNLPRDANGNIQFQPAPVGTQPSQPLPYGPGGTDFGMTPTGGPPINDPVSDIASILKGPYSSINDPQVPPEMMRDWMSQPSPSPTMNWDGTPRTDPSQPRTGPWQPPQAPVPWSLQNGLGPNAIARAQQILGQHPGGWGGLLMQALRGATPEIQQQFAQRMTSPKPQGFWGGIANVPVSAMSGFPNTGMLGLPPDMNQALNRSSY